MMSTTAPAAAPIAGALRRIAGHRADPRSDGCAPRRGAGREQLEAEGHQD
jgi:hypothetical protein